MQKSNISNTISCLIVLTRYTSDGFVYTHKKDRMWRKTRQPNRFACVGTDPNRNWEYAWGTGGSSSNPCSEAYMGPKPFSEPEPRQMAAYVQSRAPNVISYIGNNT